MSDNLPKEKRDQLEDILKEKRLLHIYLSSSRSLHISRFNVVFSMAVGAVILVITLMYSDPTSVADQLQNLASIAFANAVSLLGFLLAGFSFFATVGDREMFCDMATVIHEKSNLTYLKYNFFSFMQVFVEFLAFSVFSFLLMISMTKGLGLREALVFAIDQVQWPQKWNLAFPPRQFFASVAISAYIALCIYLLLQLKSFIFNIYHVVMTSLKWELEKRFESEHNQLLEQDPPGGLNHK